MSLRQQLHNNQLAIISLLVALIALGYNTWRNEQTEHNRNVRQAGFEMLVHIADLRRIVYLAHYDKDAEGGNPRKGWAKVLVIQDLGQLMPSTARMRTSEVQAFEYRSARDPEKGINVENLTLWKEHLNNLHRHSVKEAAAAQIPIYNKIQRLPEA